MGFYKQWWQAVMQRIIPELGAVGWNNVRAISIGDRAAIDAADVVVSTLTGFYNRTIIKELDYIFYSVVAREHKLIVVEMFGPATLGWPAGGAPSATDQTIVCIMQVHVTPLCCSMA